MLQATEFGLAQKIDDGAADRHLAANIHENGDHAENRVRMFECAHTAADLVVVGKIGQVGEFEKYRQQNENPGKAQIRNFNRIRPVGCLAGKECKNQPAANDGTNGCAK